ncbi:MAG: LPS assembly protein LptD [Pseudomonadota bacterium]|nr:LPS assembly protein LptD [Pseudomonadota bacterium]
MKRRGHLLLLAWLIFSPPAGAEPLAWCGTTNPLESQHLGLPPADPDLTRIQAFAGQIDMENEGLGLLTGDVLIQRGDRFLRTEQLYVDLEHDLIETSESLSYLGEFLDVQAQSAKLHPSSGAGQFTDTAFYIRPRSGRGTAVRIELEERGAIGLESATFTTCAVDDEAWYLRAGELSLDPDSGRGQAWGTSLWFQGWPILYSPYLQFPISDRRMSGFLAPRLGNSDDTGFDLALPWYWNIAPNQDATFTPRVMSKRGAQLQTEYRYLSHWGRGMIYNEYLPDDRDFGDDRTLWAFRHQARPARDWYADINLTEVSDVQYQEDLGNGLRDTSSRYLNRRASAGYAGPQWDLLLRAQDFQLVDPDLVNQPEPYQRLPQLLLRTRQPVSLIGPVAWDLYAEATGFEGEDQLTGDRADVELGLQIPWDRGGYFVIPRAAYRYTAYALDQATEDNGDQHPDRGVPSASLDTGVRLERERTLVGKSFIQTLEPRAFFLWVPERSQDELPLFDTRAGEFDFVRLFDTNRYIGADRIGDTAQVSTALSSRWIDARSGRTELAARIGQIYYFEDREVALANETNLDRSYSNVLAELEAGQDRQIGGYFQLEWNPDADRLTRQLAQIRYHPDDERVLNLGYRLRRDTQQPLEQVDLSFAWPVAPQWRVVGRWNYSLRGDQNLETLAGVEYQSCCWALRVAAREYVRGEDGKTNAGVYLQLELKGLGALGNDIDELLNRSISGYGTND